MYNISENSSSAQKLKDSFPKLFPLENGKIWFRNKGCVGCLHYLPEENKIAYVSTKKHYFRMFSGYAISIDILFRKIPEKVKELKENGDIPEDTEVGYILFFIEKEKEVLLFRFGQYICSQYEFRNTSSKKVDFQNITSKYRAIARWEDGYSHVIKQYNSTHQYISF